MTYIFVDNVTGYPHTTTRCQQMNLTMPRRSRLPYLHISNSGFCFYCGVLAEEIEHYIPVSKLYRSKVEITVPSCRECNDLASNKLFISFEAKIEYIHKKLRIKYKSLIAMPNWNKEEISSLSPNLQNYILANLQLRENLLQRLKWQSKDNPGLADIASLISRLQELLEKPRGSSVPANVAKDGIMNNEERF